MFICAPQPPQRTCSGQICTLAIEPFWKITTSSIATALLQSQT
jgi:hypothetical protein